MKLQVLGICVAAIAFSPVCSAEEKQQGRPDWAHFFREASAEGTIVVADERSDGGSTGIYDEPRARKRYSPASTFKIPHTLFALDAGVVRDEFQVFPWDGTKRGIETWNHDQNLRSAMRNSVVGFIRSSPGRLVKSVRVSTCEKLIMETPTLRELIRFGWKEISVFQR